MKTLAITLREEHREFIESEMKSGRYVSESDVIAAGLAELKAREQVRQARLTELRAEVSVGLQQLDRGEGREWDLASIKEKARAAATVRVRETQP